VVVKFHRQSLFFRVFGALEIRFVGLKSENVGPSMLSGPRYPGLDENEP